MKFLTMMKLCFVLLLWPRRISLAKNLHSKNEALLNGDCTDNLLKNFFANLKTAYLLKHIPRHITIVGGTSNDLRQAEPLFTSHPYIVCKNAEECGYSVQFSRGSFAVIFLDDLSEGSIEKKFGFLLRCRKCKILFVFDGNNIGVDEIRLVFTMAWLKDAHNVEFAHIVKNEVKLYTNVVTANCSVDVRLVSVWRPGIGLDEIHTWAFKLDNDMNGCPVIVSSLTFKPKMMIEEIDNVTLTIVGGREGRLLLAVAEKLNFTIDLRYPSIVDRMKYSRKMSIINDVISGIAEIGIGRILPTNDLHEMVSFSISYDEECVTWGVPLVMSPSSDIIWVEFSWEVWIPFGLIFAVICVIDYADQNLYFSRKGERTNLGFVTVMLDVFAIHLGNPVVHVSSTSGGKFMLIVYLYYATIMITAYKSYLSAILSANDGTPMFVDAEDIIKSNITVGGSLYDYNILKEQASESLLTYELMKRFVINNNDTETFHRLKYKHDYAFIARLSSMNYQKLKMVIDKESITFDTLKSCVLTYHTVIVLRKTSLLRKATDNVIRRLLESGLLQHWDFEGVYTDNILKRGDLLNYDENSDKFSSIFILYSVCIALCFVIFLIELITKKLNSKKRQRVAFAGL